MKINTDEIFDTEHLSTEELERVRMLANARREGHNLVEDDPIERGLVNGFALRVKLNTGIVANKNRNQGVEWAKVKAGLGEIEDRYQRLCKQLGELNDRIQRLRMRIERSAGLTWVETCSHKDVAPLVEESKKLYSEMSGLVSHFIRANLESYGLEDMKVVGVIHSSDNEYTKGGVTFRDGKEAGRVEMLLSNLCGMRYSGLAEKLGVDPQTVSLRIDVERGGKVIGNIGSDGDFNYEAAPDLRTALGWKIATDGGRGHLIEESFDLDRAALSLLDTINFKGLSKEAFFGPYFEMLKHVFVREHTSRGGHGGSAGILWRVATRELGEEHQGYPYCY